MTGRRTHIRMEAIESALRICRISAATREEVTDEVQIIARHIKQLQDKQAES